jgi:glycerophosphoryl diester phosphodiesterase
VTAPRRVPPRRFFHVAEGKPYHLEDSRRGVLTAIRNRFRWIDLDCQVTKDGIPIITHWGRPMERDGFRDPLGKIDPHRSVEELTWEQVSRLRTRDGYRIWRADDLCNLAIKCGLRVELELKTDAITERHLQVLRAALTKPKRVQVKTLSNLPKHPGMRLARAKRAGFKTIILARGPMPKAWQPSCDYVRGRAVWTD